MWATLRRWSDEYDASCDDGRLWPYLRWHLLTLVPLCVALVAIYVAVG